MVVLVLALEGVLRLAGVDLYPRTSTLAYQEVYTPVMRPDTHPDGTAVLRTWDPRHPWQSIPKERSPRTLRVLCFGGSAAAGLGFSPNVTFARQLEDLLVEGYPGRDVEVVNLGTVAIAAKQVRILVEDALKSTQPDAIIVWSGNNEFLPVHARRFRERHQSAVERARGAVADSYLLKGIKLALRGAPSPRDLPETSLETDQADRLTQARIIQDVVISEREQQRTIEAYAAELGRIVQTARSQGVAVLVCGVAVNVEWVSRKGLPADWLAELGGTPASAIERLDLTLARSGLSALERFQALARRATAKDLIGAVEGANADWRQAANLDPHQRRTTDPMRAAAEAVVLAAAAEDDGVGFLDGAALLRADDQRHRVGFTHFYDYVHFTPRGASVVAAGMFDALQELEAFPRPEKALETGLQSLPQVLARRLERVAEASADFFDDEEFLGVGFDPARVSSTDLWKYKALARELEDTLTAHPDNWRASAYRGNMRSYLTAPGASGGALRDWSQALEHCDDPGAKEAIQGNIDRLKSRRRVEP